MSCLHRTETQPPRSGAPRRGGATSSRCAGRPPWNRGLRQRLPRSTGGAWWGQALPLLATGMQINPLAFLWPSSQRHRLAGECRQPPCAMLVVHKRGCMPPRISGGIPRGNGKCTITSMLPLVNEARISALGGAHSTEVINNRQVSNKSAKHAASKVLKELAAARRGKGVQG
mgnify:CR=1 FL=1